MTARSVLEKTLNSKTFRDFYSLKEELVDFCRKNGLPVSGGKSEIADRIAYFLDTGKVFPGPVAREGAANIFCIIEDTEIEANFVCSQKHRKFFKEHIGNCFAFYTAFQNG